MTNLLTKAQELDQTDTLKAARERFYLPQGKIYLDGNSLGALPKHVSARVQDAILRPMG
jgi:kynureninase